MLQRIFDSIPKYLLGPIAVILGIAYFYIQDPPKTICDIQFETFRKQNQKYLYGEVKKNITLPALYLKEIQACRESNSVGGCYDWSNGLKAVIYTSRSLDSSCRDRMEELAPLLSYYQQSLRIYSQISWNDSEIVRAQLYHWLDAEDIAIFCRTKAEYVRLVGAVAYKALENSLFNELIALKKRTRQETWQRTVLSHSCAAI